MPSYPNYKVTVSQVDALLPQTQCGECGYPGCLPYAKAIINQDESIDRCIPGGVSTLTALATLLEQGISDSCIAEIAAKEKPPLLAQIREAECIGCTKCIQACPVDAIIGSRKQMHTVIAAECTGCELCIAPCPVDCIDKVNVPETRYDKDKAKVRYLARQKRIAETKKAKSLNKLREAAIKDQPYSDPRAAKKAAIRAAVARVKAKRLS